MENTTPRAATPTMYASPDSRATSAHDRSPRTPQSRHVPDAEHDDVRESEPEQRAYRHPGSRPSASPVSSCQTIRISSPKLERSQP